MQKDNTPFPVRGDNFETVAVIGNGELSLDQLQAIAFVTDCRIALDHFEKHEDQHLLVLPEIDHG